jgi:HK97 family phage major capsid protein
MKLLKQLQARKAALVAEGRRLADLAADANRMLSEDENARLVAIRAEIETVEKNLAPLLALQESERTMALPGLPGNPAPAVDNDGFKSFGEFLQAVARAGASGNLDVDPRLRMQAAVASGMSSGVGSDGGFLVRTDFSTALLNRAMTESMLAPKCFRVPIGEGFDGLEAPIIDETSRATGSRWGGVQVYRVAEAEAASAKKPKLALLDLDLLDLLGICYATDRLMRDSTALGSIIEQAFGSEFAFVLDDEILRGTGAGQMLGILNSPALVTITKEVGQTADTVLAENIVKMFAAMPPRNAARAYWLINQEVWKQLFKLSFNVGTGGVPAFMPPGGLSTAPFGTLLGRPILPIEQSSALGDVGDIVFADLQEYLLIEKGGIQADQSIHVRFLYGENTFRFKMRNNGIPVWRASRTPYKGAQAQSPFVALEAR